MELLTPPKSLKHSPLVRKLLHPQALQVTPPTNQSIRELLTPPKSLKHLPLVRKLLHPQALLVTPSTNRYCPNGARAPGNTASFEFVIGIRT
ncbi:hypothetical protein CEXT_315001 [Caerostris extrusa]|uniref:Uncharacterized protein n=1 Tax=Caerostris extrusa TaxID=172846 RepID=A0AAV4SB52_CAEEX|nr:hypothetical protein CEXT_315001 [Caerostris extrusa]